MNQVLINQIQKFCSRDNTRSAGSKSFTYIQPKQEYKSSAKTAYEKKIESAIQNWAGYSPVDDTLATIPIVKSVELSTGMLNQKANAALIQPNYKNNPDPPNAAQIIEDNCLQRTIGGKHFHKDENGKWIEGRA